MSKRTDKASAIVPVGFNPDYAKAVKDICEIYDDALRQILESKVCCAGSADLKIIAQNAVVKAFQISHSVKTKIGQN